jgi:hypothetical protein
MPTQTAGGGMLQQGTCRQPTKRPNYILQNLVDSWTKHHPASHHKAFWPQILTSSTSKPATEVYPSSHGNFHPLTTLMNTATKSFVKKILSAPAFVEQLAAQQQTIAAKGA